MEERRSLMAATTFGGNDPTQNSDIDRKEGKEGPHQRHELWRKGIANDGG